MKIWPIHFSNKNIPYSQFHMISKKKSADRPVKSSDNVYWLFYIISAGTDLCLRRDQVKDRTKVLEKLTY